MLFVFILVQLVAADCESDYAECELFYDEIYNECWLSCAPGDFMCTVSCTRDYTDNLSNCPCQTNCPDGCPCPIYNCPSTTTTQLTTSTAMPTSILILNTWQPENYPILTDSSGKVDTNFTFTFNPDTEVSESCSI